MTRKDFTQASTKRVYDAITEATQETPETPEAPEAQEEPKPKRKYKDRKEYTPEEAAAFLDSFQSAGRKGLKLPRINLAFEPANYQYVKTMSRVRGESITTFINWLIKTHMDQNKDLYTEARQFIDRM